MAFQDFTTYTETDPTSAITVTSTKTDVSAIVESADAFVVKDFGASYFTDFTHDFEAYLGSTTTTGIHAIIWGMSNAADMVSTDASAALFVRAYQDTTDTFEVGDKSSQNGVTISVDTLYYCTVGRSGTTLTLDVYSDSGRTSLVGTNSTTVVSTAFRYLYGFSNYGNEVGAFTWTGYSQNFELNGSSLSSSPSSSPSTSVSSSPSPGGSSISSSISSSVSPSTSISSSVSSSVSSSPSTSISSSISSSVSPSTSISNSPSSSVSPSSSISASPSPSDWEYETKHTATWSFQEKKETVWSFDNKSNT